MKIKKPKKFMDIKFVEINRVKTGIIGLDDIIEGGFPSGSIITVSGDAGSGKTTFAVQFLYMGATKYKEPGMLVLFDEHKKPLFRNMLRYGWDLEKLEKERKLIILEYPPHEVEHFVSQETVIHDLIKEIGIKRLAVDSITSVALLYESEQKRRQGLLKMIEKIRRWGCTTLLLTETTEESSLALQSKFGVEYLSEGLIYLYNSRRKDYRERAIEVIKLRGTAHECRMYPMKITSEGIVIYPSQHVFED